MQAQTLNCPMCGAAALSDSTKCDHCGARLATVSCPSCFGMMFEGAKFCSHCGARADRTEFDPQTVRPCPRCKTNTKAIVIGKTDLRECPKCEGIWADAESLKEICADSERQSAVLGMATPIEKTEKAEIEEIRYRPCPVCKQLMNRVNFANCSAVIVDVCRPHGTWFDKDELRRIVEFIRAGGIERSRARELDEFERKKREASAGQISSAGSSGGNYSGFGGGLGDTVSDSTTGSLLADVLVDVASGLFSYLMRY